MDTDRNLLFGMLAVQAEAITAEQFHEAYTSWATDKLGPFADALAERGWISAEERATIEALVVLRLRKHQDDAGATLAAMADQSARDTFSEIQAAAHDHTVTHDSSPVGHVLLSTISHQPGSRDRYTLTRLHAQGGIGRVWLARDVEFGRDVALKELRPERSANPAVWSRFLEEARITGQLEHPGIVPVYELSNRPGERNPFYTMRFVRGRTLTEAVRAYHANRRETQVGPLDLQALLTSFLGVCNAVAYAHSRGVIHRDLKGHNVVLGDYGEVMVLDWGLAKFVNRTDESPTADSSPVRSQGHDATLEGQILGTPGYMPPEQAQGQLERVNEQSDVYGLGAILYDILTDAPPFSGATGEEVLQHVIHDEPTPPRQLNPQAPPTLEAVCLKALAKRPEDRYASASELGDEIKRFLADEPVSAYREPLSIRVTRWGRRHRTAATSVAVLLVTAVVGLSVGTVLINRERAKAEANFQLAEANFQLAEANFRQARTAVDEYFTTVSESKLLDVPGLQPLRKELLEAAQKYYQDFLRKRATDPSVRADAATASFRVGWINHTLGRPTDALEPYRAALRIYEALLRRNPDDIVYRERTAVCHGALGFLLGDLGRTSDAMESHKRALAFRQDIVKAHPNDIRAQDAVARTHRNIGNLHRAAGKLEDALAEWKIAITMGEALVKKPLSHDDGRTELTRRSDLSAVVRGDLAGAYLDQADALRDAGKLSEAQVAWRRARDLHEALQKERPDDLVLKGRLAGLYLAGGTLHIDSGKLADAEIDLKRSMEIQASLAAENPSIISYRFTLAETQLRLGWVLRQLGRDAEALELYRKAVGLTEGLLAETSNGARAQSLLGQALTQQANVVLEKGQSAEARRMLQRALDLLDPLVQREPTSVGYQSLLSHTLRGIGRTEIVALHPKEARAALERASQLDRTFAETYPSTRYNLACTLALLIPVAEPNQREDVAKQAIEALRLAIRDGGTNLNYLTKDRDLESVRSRPEFQSLLAQMQAKVSANK